MRLSRASPPGIATGRHQWETSRTRSRSTRQRRGEALQSRRRVGAKWCCISPQSSTSERRRSCGGMYACPRLGTWRPPIPHIGRRTHHQPPPPRSVQATETATKPNCSGPGTSTPGLTVPHCAEVVISDCNWSQSSTTRVGQGSRRRSVLRTTLFIASIGGKRVIAKRDV